MSEKSTSEYWQCQFQRGQDKCCEGHDYGILASIGSWKQLDFVLHERRKWGKMLSSVLPLRK